MAQSIPNENGKLEELKRTSRILEIVLMISARPRRYLRKHLAERFSVSDRQIQKDLEVIRHGLKLILIHTRQGYYFEETPSLPALQYSFAEALALITATQAAQQVSGAGSAELAAALARLEALFPDEFASLLRRVNQPPVLTAQRKHRQQMLTLFNRALLEERKVRMVYETASRQGQISERVVHPYHIMPYVRSWQLIAYCERRARPLMFKLDRIHQATLLDEHYGVPPDFDVNEYMGDAWGVMRGEGPAEMVVVQFDEDAARWVGEEQWHASQEIEQLEDGGILFQVEIAITPEFVSWLLYYGGRAEVLEPAHLRRRVADAHWQAAARYMPGRG